MAFLYIFESRSFNPTIMLSPVPNIHLFAVFPKAHRNKLKTENTSNSFWSSIVYSHDAISMMISAVIRN